MKVITNKIIFSLLLFISNCTPYSKSETLSNEELNVICPTTQRQFGDIMVCLPNISNYKECYENKYVRERADEEVSMVNNQIIAVYLNDDCFSKFEKEPYKIFWSEHIKIYGHPPLMNKDVPISFFDQIENKLRKDSQIVDWDEVVKKINETKIGYTIERPALIEIYQSHEKIKSVIYLADYNYLGESGKLLWSANMCIIKNRLIYYSYSMILDRSETKKVLKIKSDAFGKELLKLNNS